MRKSDIDKVLQSYDRMFPRLPLKHRIAETWFRATGYRDPYLCYLTRLDHCYICGKQEDLLFNFARLIPVWSNEDIDFRYICRDHGGKTGEIIFNSLTGEQESIPPAQPWPIIMAKNIGQSLYLKGAIGLRFAWFLIRDWFIHDIARPLQLRLLRLLLPD